MTDRLTAIGRPVWFDSLPAVPPAMASVVTALVAVYGGWWWIVPCVGLIVMAFVQRRAALWCAFASIAVAAMCWCSAPRSLPVEYFYGIHVWHARADDVRTYAGSQIVTASVSDSCGDFRTRLFVTGTDPELHAGDSIAFVAGLSPALARTAVPYVGEVPRSERLSATAVVTPENIERTGASGSWIFLPQRCAVWLRGAIDRSQLGFRTCALLDAALLGHTAPLPDAMLAFRASGLAHLLCVSGFHVGLVLILLSWLISPVRLWTGNRIWRLFVLLPVMWIFVMGTGASEPSVRAGVMITIVLVADAMERDHPPLNSLAAAVFVIVLSNPYSVFSASLWLSVSAVAGLVCLAWRWNPFTPETPWLYRICGYAATCTAASLSTFPVVAAVFHSVPLLGIPANLLVVPVFPVFVYAGLLTVLLNAMGICVPHVAMATDFMANYFEAVASAAVSGGQSTLTGLYPDAVSVAMAVAALVALAAVFVARTWRWRTLLAAVCITLGAFAAGRPMVRPQAEIVFAGREVIVNTGTFAVINAMYTGGNPYRAYQHYMGIRGISADSISILRNPECIVAGMDTIVVVDRNYSLRDGAGTILYVRTNSRAVIGELTGGGVLSVGQTEAVVLSPVLTAEIRVMLTDACRCRGIVVHDLGLAPLALPYRALPSGVIPSSRRNGADGDSVAATCSGVP